MNKKLIFLKLGGSLITDKAKPYTAKYDVISDLARQIKEALDEDNKIKLVIRIPVCKFIPFVKPIRIFAVWGKENVRNAEKNMIINNNFLEGNFSDNLPPKK